MDEDAAGCLDMDDAFGCDDQDGAAGSDPVVDCDGFPLADAADAFAAARSLPDAAMLTAALPGPLALRCFSRSFKASESALVSRGLQHKYKVVTTAKPMKT
jgi:hypothetical protein